MPVKLNRRRIIKCSLCVLIIVVGLLITELVIVSVHRPYSLLEHSTFLAHTSEWNFSFWLDNQTLLSLEKNINTNIHAFNLDIITRQKHFLPALSTTLNRLGTNCYIDISPDGKWLLVRPWKQLPETHCLVSVATGKMYIRRKVGPFLFWLPDSKGWVIASTNGKDHHIYKLQIDNDKITQYSNRTEIMGDIIGTALDNSYFMANWSPHQTSTVNLSKINVQSGKLVKLLIVLGPSYADVSNLQLSPDVKKIGWHCRLKGYVSFWNQLLSITKSDSDSIWVSNIDGQTMKHLGDVKVKYVSDYDSNLILLAWSPDGKYLSYEYDKRLYIVKAE